MEQITEELVQKFSGERGSNLAYPISDADLSSLAEYVSKDYDENADLRRVGQDVEGATKFAPPSKPTILISKFINSTNRRKMTIAHEIGHAHLHAFLFDLDLGMESFLKYAARAPIYCNRETIYKGYDWLEWQAAFAGGALLMPRQLVRDRIDRLELRPTFPVYEGESAARIAIEAVSKQFSVSYDAAKTRLSQLGYLRPTDTTKSLFVES
jgi:Zn-dependent peptidase ImmA (M78 family)